MYSVVYTYRIRQEIEPRKTRPPTHTQNRGPPPTSAARGPGCFGLFVYLTLTLEYFIMPIEPCSPESLSISYCALQSLFFAFRSAGADCRTVTELSDTHADLYAPPLIDPFALDRVTFTSRALDASPCLITFVDRNVGRADILFDKLKSFFCFRRELSSLPYSSDILSAVRVNLQVRLQHRPWSPVFDRCSRPPMRFTECPWAAEPEFFDAYLYAAQALILDRVTSDTGDFFVCSVLSASLETSALPTYTYCLVPVCSPAKLGSRLFYATSFNAWFPYLRFC